MKKEQVSLIECKEYEFEAVKKAVEESFENLGGIDRYIDKGDRVLLKVNLLIKKKPEFAATTHPVFTKALASVLIDYGASVVIGDSPGGPFNERMLKGIYRVSGMEQIAEETGAELNYNTESAVVENPKGKYLKELTIAKMVLDADKVISVSKLKTHGLTIFTGAVKNMFGIIPGLKKPEFHLTMPEVKEFSEALLDICLYGSPTLSFMDGIVGMEGAGPSGGEPREIGAVIASGSPYHLDVVASSLINLKPGEVPTIQRCIERNICKDNLEDIDILGLPISHFLLEDYAIPEYRTRKLIADWMPGFLKTFIEMRTRPRPIFNHERCIACGNCVESCPPQIISMEDQRPVADLDRCIRCFCCQELCPVKAVKIHRPWLLRQMTRF